MCQVCEFWRGACVKGHPLQSPVGCPIKKFPPVEGAGYHPDMLVPAVSNDPAPPCQGCGAVKEPEVQPMTWAQAMASFQDSMARAKAAGWPLLEDKPYADRQLICRSCEWYRWFQCRWCKCVIWFKARLATEDCPKGLWPKP